MSEVEREITGHRHLDNLQTHSTDLYMPEPLPRPMVDGYHCRQAPIWLLNVLPWREAGQARILAVRARPWSILADRLQEGRSWAYTIWRSFSLNSL